MAEAAVTARPRGTLARCLFAWTAGGLATLSVLVVALTWVVGVLSADGTPVPGWLQDAAFPAYMAGWLGTITFTPLAAIAAVLAGGRQGRTAALAGIVWVLLVTLQSVIFRIADTSAAEPWMEPVYAASAFLVMGVVPLAIAAATLLAGSWRWQSGAS